MPRQETSVTHRRREPGASGAALSTATGDRPPTPRQRPAEFVRRHPLATFFVLAFAISWAPFPGYLAGLLPAPIFLPLGPLVAAVAVISVSEGKAGLRQLGSRMIKWRVRWWVWAVALGLPVSVILLSAALNARLWDAPHLDWTDVSLTGVVASFAVRLINPLNGPMGEEPGWRGYALPRLLSTMSPLRSAATLGVVVAVWHLPLMVMGMLSYLQLPVIFAVMFVYCWLILRSGGSVLVTLVFHASEGCIRPNEMGLTGDDLTSYTATYAIVWTIVAAVLVLVDRQAWRSPRSSAHESDR